MIQIQLNEGGVSDVRIIAMSEDEERRGLLVWPAIRIFVQLMNDILETEHKQRKISG